MLRAWLFLAVAILGITFALWTSLRSTRPTLAAPAVSEPPAPAYATFIAGAGLVESASENIAIGTPVAGVVVNVPVAIGDRVAAGAALVQLDDRQQQSRRAEAEAQLARIRTQLARLKALPRAEDVLPAAARVSEAQAVLADVKDQLDRAQRAALTGSISEDLLSRRNFSLQIAVARSEEALAALAVVNAGAWAPDIAMVEADVRLAESQVASALTDIARLTIIAPFAGTVLTLDVRPGQFAAAGPTALLTLGDTTTLHVRVDIDEQVAWRMTARAAGTATVRGNSARLYHLTWLRTDPYVRPKKSLTGDSTERVDTRVLQVVYRIDEPTGLYVGQQMDVQIQTLGLTGDRVGDPATTP